MPGETVISLKAHGQDKDGIRYDEASRRWITYVTQLFNFYNQTGGPIEPTLDQQDNQIPLLASAALPSDLAWVVNGGNLEYTGPNGVLWIASMATEWTMQMNNNTEFTFSIGAKLNTGSGVVVMLEKHFPFISPRSGTFPVSLDNTEIFILPVLGDTFEFYCRDDTTGTRGQQLLLNNTSVRLSL
jgi:hypothetical protein